MCSETYEPMPPIVILNPTQQQGFLRIGTDGSLTEDEKGSYMGAAIVVDANPASNCALQQEQASQQQPTPTEIVFITPVTDTMEARKYTLKRKAHESIEYYIAPPAHPVYVRRLTFNARADDISSTTAEHIALNEALALMQNVAIYTDSAVAMQRIQLVQERLDQLPHEFINSYQYPHQILQQGMVTSNHNANEWMFAPQTLFNIQPAFMETLLLSQITSEILCLRRKHKL
jgi:hypothetical protein